MNIGREGAGPGPPKSCRIVRSGRSIIITRRKDRVADVVGGRTARSETTQRRRPISSTTQPFFRLNLPSPVPSVVNEGDRVKKGKIRRTFWHRQQKVLAEESFPKRLLNMSHCCQRQIKTL